MGAGRVSLSGIDNHLDHARGGDEEVLAAARGGDPKAVEALVTAHYDRVHALCRRMLGNEPDALDATQDTLVAALRALGHFDGRSSFGTWIYRIATNTCIDEMRRRRRRPVTGMAADIAEVADEVSFGAPGLFVLPTRPDSTRPDPTRPDTDSSEPLAEGVGEGDRPAATFGPSPTDWSQPVGGARHSKGVGGLGGGPDPADVAVARVDIDAALAALPVEFRTAIVLRDVCDLPYDEIAEILDVPVGTVRSRIARARSALAVTWRTGGDTRAVPSEGATRPDSGNFSGPPVVRPAEKDRRPTDTSPSGERRGHHPESVSEKSQEEEHTQ